MTDPEPRPTPEEEARVRRLLADARHDEPMPPEVVARLDRVLAGLADDAAAPAAAVTPLPARRRRAARLLVAAAAVVAVGIGLGQVIDLGGTTADQEAGAPAADSEPAPQDGAQEEAAPEPDGLPTGSDSLAPQADAPVVRIRPDAFARGAQMARDNRTMLDRSELTGGAVSAYGGCRPGAWGEGTFVPVRYGRAPAVLVLRRSAGDTQVADLFLCGDREPVRSVTLPAP